MAVPTPGVFLVTVPEMEPRPGAKAVAVMVPPGAGVSFILLGTDPDEGYLKENVPHELSHLVFHAALAQQYEGREPGFALFIDEVLARGTGGAPPQGYPPRGASEAELCRTGELNGLLEKICALRDRRDVPEAGPALMGIALASSTFAELRQSLENYKKWLEGVPEKPTPAAIDNPWGSFFA